MDCILLAAGIGQRMGEDIPKQFLRLNGKPIIIYSLEVLSKYELINNIYITYNEKYKDLYTSMIHDYNFPKCILVQGGETRHDSVFIALQYVNSNRVLLHEAARPFINSDQITQLINEKESAVVPTIPIPFTVSSGQGYMTGELDRSQLNNIQLPQAFNVNDLRDAHEKAKAENYIATEDGIIMHRAGFKVKFVPGYENNIKITTPLDLAIAEIIDRGMELI
ncbi:MAG: 2-C-methyl-D-erythritol 4-phosphate cytidylyltransferase [Candidatus Marinimicrobia bacterium]|jgi:2-C-methyl-D-erythritol 4-phosphate cytidylyltransferase|nr:2-C-methyl-D-erythritol 4-phosphate cytidylyltransferase [Candidatus Neomarinimicrobiota bacterium]|tara:strand:- start:798 stop:1463 length:666 start_codon:yes stop_codon:yes gene_type:complete